MSESQPTTGHPGEATSQPGDELKPLAVSTARVIMWGQVGWVLALVVILVVPSLHRDERDWWPWVPVAGLALGLIGYLYVRRGRGNAAGAE